MRASDLYQALASVASRSGTLLASASDLPGPGLDSALRAPSGARNRPHRPELRLDYPLNLSILVSGGIETEQDPLSNGERTGVSSHLKAGPFGPRVLMCRHGSSGAAGVSPLATGVTEGEIPVCHSHRPRVRTVSSESCSLRWERKAGGTFHPKLNTDSRPIANKYREGKVQSTLKRGLNVPEIAVMQAYETCSVLGRLGAPG